MQYWELESEGLLSIPLKCSYVESESGKPLAHESNLNKSMGNLYVSILHTMYKKY